MPNPWDVPAAPPGTEGKKPWEGGPVSSGPRDPSFSSMTEQAGVGIYKAGTGLAGLPGDIGRAVAGGGGGYPFPEYSPSQVFGPALSKLPGQSQIEKILEPITGPVPAAQNTSEEYARTFGEFFPLAAGGSATLFQRIARVLYPSVTAETAKQGAKKMGFSDEAAEWAKFAGAVTPATLSYMWRTAPDRAEEAMNQLFKNSRENYKHPDVTGLQIKLPIAQREAYRIADDLFQNYGMRAGPVADELNRMAFPLAVAKKQTLPANMPAMGQSSISYSDISSIRNRLSGIMQDFNNPHDQMLARVAKSKIDDWMTRLGQNDLAAGDAQKATARLADARSDWWAAKSLEELGTKIYQGVIGSGASYSGQNMENAVRQRIASVLKREKEFPSGQYTDKEIALMEKSAVPTGGEQLARRVSKMLPRHGAMSTIVGMLGGQALGHPFEGALAGAAVGEVAQTIESKLANKILRDVQEEILSRSASRSKVRLPDRRIDLFSPAVLGRPEGEGGTLKFDIMGNLISPAEANEATLRSLPESAARVERERKRREAEAK